MPLTTNSQAKKKCQWRPIDNHCAPGIVAHDGKPRATAAPSLPREAPSTPVVSKLWPAMRVTPFNPAAPGACVAISATQGSVKVESRPQ